MSQVPHDEDEEDKGVKPYTSAASRSSASFMNYMLQVPHDEDEEDKGVKLGLEH